MVNWNVTPGIQIKWDKAMRIYVRLDPEWQGKVCGLCGNYNGNAMDDFTTHSRQIVDKPVIFGGTWQSGDYSCSSPTTEPQNPCEVNKEREAWAISACSVLRNDLLRPCHSVVCILNSI